MDLTEVLELCGKSRSHRDSVSGLSTPQGVAIPTQLLRRPYTGYTRMKAKQSLYRPGQALSEAFRFQDTRQMKVVKLSVLRAGRRYPP